MAQASPYRDQSQSFKEKAAEGVENMAERATDQLKGMADRASGAAGRVAEQGREAGERVQDVAGNFKGAVDKSIRDQPMATLALAAVAGFLSAPYGSDDGNGERQSVFKGLINDIKSAAASFLSLYLARASVAVPFVVALGLATAAVGLELTERFGATERALDAGRRVLRHWAVGFPGVTMKEQQQEIEAEEEQQRSDGGIGEMTSAAATQAATHLPVALLGVLMQNPSIAALPIARAVGRNMPLALLVLLVAFLLWPTEQAEESVGQGTIPRQLSRADSKLRRKRSLCGRRPERT